MGKILFSRLCPADQWGVFDRADRLGIGNVLFQRSGNQSTCGLCSVHRSVISLYQSGADSRHCTVGVRLGSCAGQYDCKKKGMLSEFRSVAYGIVAGRQRSDSAGRFRKVFQKKSENGFP